MKWLEDKILVGTKTSAIIEVDVKDRSRPKILVCGHSEGEMWALDTHPKKDNFVTGKITERFSNQIFIT